MPKNTPTVQELLDRNEARISRLTPLTVEERLQAFAEIGYHPYGLFIPEDKELRAALTDRVRELAHIPDKDQRDSLYIDLQEETAGWEESGIPGRWAGQMGCTRSRARFRIVAWGRQTGKSQQAVMEAIAQITKRPRSVVWVCAPNDTTVSRCFDRMVEAIQDLGIPTTIMRNAANNRLIILANGSRVEGVSLDKSKLSPGATVNLAIIDESAFISEDDWQRRVLPPLTSTGGQALLLSSWEGEGNFFFNKAEEAKAERDIARLDGGEDRPEPAWEFFRDETWNNFFVYPGGYEDVNIRAAREELKLSPREFLEQFGAIPSGVKGRVFGEFKERVHVGYFPFRPDLDVTLVVDPSSGAAPYAVGAIQTDGPLDFLIDEFYETGASAEQIFPILRRRPWHGMVKDVIVDPAWPAEIDRWNKPVDQGGGGYRAFPLPMKPQVEQRIPIYRERLRDSGLFETFRRKRMLDIMAEHGISGEQIDRLPAEDLIEFDMLLEQSLSDDRVTEEDVEKLRDCSHFFIDRHCVHAIKEHRMYSYARQKSTEPTHNTFRERPRDSWNHLLDGIGYFAWFHYRFETPERGRADYSYLNSGFQPKTAELGPNQGVEYAPPDGPKERAHAFTVMMRASHRPKRTVDYGTRVYRGH